MNYRPHGHHAITPYLTVPDVRKMIDFYTRAFGAETLYVVQPHEKLVSHAEIRIGDSVIQLRERLPALGRGKAPEDLGGTTVTFTLWTDDLDRLYDTAVGAGAIVNATPEMMPWGHRAARVTDPAGHCWTLETVVDSLSPAEQEERAKEHILDRLGLT